MHYLSWILKAPRLMLALGAAIASAFNFYSFVVFPSLTQIADLDNFVRDNYLGGLYLFGIGSSVGSYSVYVFVIGKKKALLRYLILSFCTLSIIGLIGSCIARIPWSYICLLAGVCMHAAGFFLAGLIRQLRVQSASLLQVVQPLLFAVFLTFSALSDQLKLNWSICYLLSCFICVLIFAKSVDWVWLRETLHQAPLENPTWGKIVLRILFAVSFPLFFQLELILCGEFSNVNLGVYSMLQKLYASISISLFGSLGMLLLSEGLKDGQPVTINVNRPVVLMALSCSAIVPIVGLLVAEVTRSFVLPLDLMFMSSAVAFLFSLGSYLSLKVSIQNPMLGLLAFIIALITYCIFFITIKPDTAYTFLFISGVFFFTFSVVTLFLGKISIAIR